MRCNCLSTYCASCFQLADSTISLKHSDFHRKERLFRKTIKSNCFQRKSGFLKEIAAFWTKNRFYQLMYVAQMQLQPINPLFRLKKQVSQWETNLFAQKPIYLNDKPAFFAEKPLSLVHKATLSVRNLLFR